MSPKSKAVLPSGNGSLLTGISDNLTFHASPESFIVKQILAFHKDHPEEVNQRIPVRAKILNRNVIILSSYHHIKQVLDCSDGNESHEALPFVATAPYRQLMEDFFPPPNLLLRDGCPHKQMRTRWEQSASRLRADAVESNIIRLTSRMLTSINTNDPFDIYTVLKDLTWRLFLYTFLGLDEDNSLYQEFVTLQEDLLRGQFSLFPVSVNTRLWQSPRSRGVNARKRLQRIIAERLASNCPAWLVDLRQDHVSQEEIANHLLMATSSLAVKGFASLLMAFLLNIFLFRNNDRDTETLSKWTQDNSKEESKARIRSVLAETMRLSPPIVGVMRRATSEQVLQSHDKNDTDTMVPAGWDVWSYFPGGNREHAIFGQDADIFRPDRYLQAKSAPPQPIVFGAGPKTCLGASFVQDAATAVLKAFDEHGFGLEGSVSAIGVRGWLGWDIASPEQWARDMKQLPTQRPSKAIKVNLTRRRNVANS